MGQPVGRGNASHGKIRQYLIGRATALNAPKGTIPATWNADGSLKDAKSAAAPGVQRAIDAILVAKYLGDGPVAVPSGWELSERGKRTLAAALEQRDMRTAPDRPLRGTSLLEHHRAVDAEIGRRLGKARVSR